jgi:hypothetical protein
MADIPSTPQSGELAYRPISALALAGLILGCLFAGMVVISTVVGLVQGLPMFLPGWALALALGAAVVSILAQYRIQSSEGTLAGLALARWGLWLSVLLGVTYFVYTWVTGLALTKQATDFLMEKADEESGFFPRLKNAGKNRTDLYQAFLLSLPVTNRGGSKASNEQEMLNRYDQPGKDGEGGNLSKFSKHPLVLALSKNPDAAIVPLSVVEWSYDKNAYHVVRNYRISIADLVFELPVAVQSSEGAKEGEQRKWFVDMSKVPGRFPVRRPTARGDKTLTLRQDSKNYLERRRRELFDNLPMPEYKDTDTDWDKVVPQAGYRDHIRKVLTEVFACRRRPPFQIGITSDDDFADLSVVDGGRIQVLHLLRMILSPSSGQQAFNLETEFTLETAAPIDLDAPLDTTIIWNIRKVRLTRAVAAPQVTSPPGL